MNFKHLLAIYAFAFFAISGLASAHAEDVTPVTPVSFVGIYEIVSAKIGGRSYFVDRYPTRQIEIAVDLSTNTLKSYIYESFRDNVGDYFVVPFTNVNLEARTTESMIPMGCRVQTQKSRSTEGMLVTTIETETKLGCRITVKKRVIEATVKRLADPSLIQFILKKQFAPLETTVFKQVR